MPEPWKADLTSGESIAVDGCCLTVRPSDDGLTFDLSEETMSRTKLGRLSSGSRVNLERALKASDRLGGHFVLGHVDGLATITEVGSLDQSWRLVVEVPQDMSRLIVDKGSIALDGISLTVVEPVGNRFSVAIIPETWARTNLSDRRIGDAMNIELDILAKHIAKLWEAHLGQQ
jgi:riboflavin synthase